MRGDTLGTSAGLGGAEGLEVRVLSRLRLRFQGWMAGA